MISPFLARISLLSLIVLTMPAAAGAEVDVRVGLGGYYKLGHWTPVLGMAEPNCVAQVIAPDSDGVLTVASQELINFGNLSLRTRTGRRAPIRIRLLRDDRLIGEQVIRSVKEPAALESGAKQQTVVALAATDLFVLRISETTSKPSKSLTGFEAEDATHAQITDARWLPRHWSGYDAANRIVIEATAGSPLSELEANDPRVTALIEWVRMGGRLVLSCGTDAEAILGQGRALEKLTPGKFARTLDLPQTSPLERFADAELAMEGSLRVVQLKNVRGEIEAHGPGRASDLPLVVRTPVGFGEVTFLAFDLGAKPLIEWEDRESLLRKIAGRRAARSIDKNSDNLGPVITRGYDDLAAAMRSRLGAALPGVTTVPFLAIVAAAIGYLALIGPGDFFLVKKVLKRMELTWITFPATVLLTGAAAYGLAFSLKSSEPQINSIELVDVNTITGELRGAWWAEAYSPQSRRYDVAIAPQTADGQSLNNAEAQLAWFGSPGKGLAGMLSAADDSATLRSGYQLNPNEGELIGLPIHAWSTKTLTARWSARAGQGAQARIRTDLTPTDSELIEGTLINNTDAKLLDVKLLYGDWAWRLGTLSPGEVKTIDAGVAPVKFPTILRRDYGESRSTQLAAERIVVEDLPADGLLHLMMFARKLGGRKFTELGNRYQPFCDLSHQLSPDQAIIIARLEKPRTKLIHGEQSYAEPSEASQTFYRFILPVQVEN